MSAATAAIAQVLAQVDKARLAGNRGDAEALCRDILRFHPNSPEALNFLALLIAESDALEEAEMLLRRAVALMPQGAALRNNLGNLLRRKGDLPGAATAYREALARDADYSEAYYNLGVVLRELDRQAEALAAQQAAVALRPSYAEALTEIGSLQNDLGQHEEALKSLNEALAVNREYFAARYYQGTTLMALHRNEEAADALRKAVALRPKSYEAQYALGNALLYTNQEMAALDAYKKTIEINPLFLDAHYDFNSLAWTMGRRDLNFKSYLYARSAVGDTSDLLLAEGDLHLRLNQVEQALPLLIKARELAPERADIANALGRALSRLGRYAESISQLKLAVQLEPETIHHHQEYAIALLHDSQPAEAIHVLEHAHAIMPDDQLVLGLLTLAYREMNDVRLGAIVDPQKFVRSYDLLPPAGFVDIRSFNAALAEELTARHTHNTAPFDQTLRGGTQTVGHLFRQRSKAIAQFRECVAEIIADYICSLPDDRSHPLLSRKQEVFSFFGAWSCRLRSAGYHTNHVHPQGWISSAYYVSLPDSVPDSKDKEGWLKFGESNLNLSNRDKPEHVVQPTAGKLVLFPSYFWHGTIPFHADGTRLTIAFDVVPGQTIAGRPPTIRNY